MGKKSPRDIEIFKESSPEIRRSYVTSKNHYFHPKNVSTGEQASTTMSGGGTGLQDETQNLQQALDGRFSGTNEVERQFPRGLELVYSEQFLMSKLSDVPQLSHT